MNLIERLRDRYSKHSQELRDEAAAEIERLTAECAIRHDVLMELKAENAKLQAVVDSAKELEQGEYCADGYRNCSVNECDLQHLREKLAALEQVDDQKD